VSAERRVASADSTGSGLIRILLALTALVLSGCSFPAAECRSVYHIPVASFGALVFLAGAIVALLCASWIGALNFDERPPRPEPALLLVGNWPSGTAYAWQMIEKFWCALARAHPERRTVLCFPTLTTVSPALLAAGIEVIDFDFDFSKPMELERFIRRHNIGHLYLSDRPYFSRVYRLLRGAGVQSITLHDHTPGERTVPKGLKRLAKAVAVRWMGCDAYIATTPYVVERLRHVVGVPPERCHLAQNGTTANPFSRADSTVRAELGLPEDTLLVVSCSRAAVYKRIHDIIDAAALVRTHSPYAPICFIHLGDGPDLERFVQHVRQKGLQGSFRLLGARSDVPQILAGCDIAVHASQGEVGYSLAQLEFMAAGLPSVVADEPSVCGCIRDGETGLLFRSGSPESLAGQLVRLIDEAALRERLGSAARQAVLAEYDLRDTIASVVKTVSAVVARESLYDAQRVTPEEPQR
jgi:glycosyltransferase involved in cell wall biosynthesis